MVFIQLLGVVLSFLTIYFVAGDMGPEVYSLVGVYSVIATITLTFSDLGLETTLMREALYWKECGKDEKISEYASQAIISRIMAFTVLTPILLGYLWYISITKYSGNYMLLFVMFYVGACVAALNDAMALTIRAIGGYVFSAAAKSFNIYIIKFICILLYFRFGAMVYLYVYGLSSLPLLVFFVIRLRKLLSISHLKLKDTWAKVWKAKYLWLRTDLDYFKGNADGLLVSLIFPSTVMGTYAVYKQIESILRGVLDGFFDVLSQNTVRYKGNVERMRQQERAIKKGRNIIVIVMILGMGIYVTLSDFWIRLVHLDKYEMIGYMIFCSLVVAIIYALGKYELNALAFFASPELNFKYAFISFVVAVFSFSAVIFLPDYYGISMQRYIVYGINSVIGVVIFRRIREGIYSMPPENS